MAFPSSNNAVDLAAILDSQYPREIQNLYQGLPAEKLNRQGARLDRSITDSRQDIREIDNQVAALDNDLRGLEEKDRLIDQEVEKLLAMAQKEKDSIKNKRCVLLENKSHALEKRSVLVADLENDSMEKSFIEYLDKHSHSRKLYAVNSLKTVAAHVGATDPIEIKGFSFHRCSSVLHQFKNLGLDANKEFAQLFVNQDVRMKFGDVPFVDTRNTVSGRFLSVFELQHRIWVYLGYPLADFHSAKPRSPVEEEMKRKYATVPREQQPPPLGDIVIQPELQDEVTRAMETAVSAILGSPKVRCSKDVRDAIAASVTSSLKKRRLPSGEDDEEESFGHTPRKEPRLF